MPSLGDLTVGFGVNLDGLITGFAAARDHISGFGGIAAGVLAGVGVAAVGTGIAAVKMAGDFEEGMTTLVTGAGESASNLKLVSDGILKLAVDTGTTTKQLTDGMYMIESAGYHGADGLKVLQTAAQGAKVGNADLGVVANALTTFMTDYHLKTNMATNAMNALTVTVASGKTHLQDLAGSMGTILPLASSLGVSFPEVGAALATMTNAGMDANRASQDLAFLLRGFSIPTSASVKALQSVGLTAQQLKDDLTSDAGLTGALQDVSEHIGKKFPADSVQAVEAWKHITGGAVGYNAALMLTGQNFKTFTSNTQAIGDAFNKGSDSVQGWSKVQDDFNFKMSKAKEVVETLMIKIGTGLLPVLGPLFDKVSSLIQNFSDWIDKSGNLQTVINDVGSVLTDLGTFIQTVGGYIETNLIPPFQDLISNLSESGNQAGGFKGVLDDLGNAIGIASQVLGTLVGWVSDFVGWMNKGGPATDAVKTAIVGVAGVIAGFKLTEWLVGVENKVMDVIGTFGKWKDKIGEVLDFFRTKFSPGAQQALNDVGKSADTAGNSVESIGTKAQVAEGEVATAATEEEASLTTVGTDAKLTAGGVASIGPAASTAEIGLGGLVAAAAPLAGIALLLTQIVETLKSPFPVPGNSDQSLGGFLRTFTPGGLSNLIWQQQQQGGANTDNMQHTSNANIEPGLVTGHAIGGVIPAGQFGIVNDAGPELMFGGSSGISVLPAPQTTALFSGSAGGGARQPATIILEINGQQFAAATVDDMGAALVQRVRMGTAVRR